MSTLDIEFEKDVLAASIRDVAFVRTALPVLRRHDFSTKVHAWIWEVIRETYESARELPTGRLFGVRLDRDWGTEEEREFAETVLLGIWRREVQGVRTALEEIRRFVRLAAIRRAAGDALEGLDEDDLETAERALVTGAEETRGAALLSEPQVWAESAEDRLRKYRGGDDASVRISFRTPLPSLDRMTNGGMRPGRVGLIVASTNVGKTSFSVDLGFTALFHSGAVVVHVTTEETEEECAARYDARFTGIDRSKFLGGDLSEDDRVLFREKFSRRKEITRRLFVAEVPPNSKIGAARVVIERARELFPDLPILCVLDSMDHLRSDRKMESFRLDASNVAWTIKGWTLDPTLAPLGLWTTVAAPAKSGGKGKAPDAEDTSESKDKAKIADLILALKEGEALDDGTGARAIEAIVTKNRLGAVKYRRIYAVARLGICKFEESATRAAAEE